VSTSDLAGGAVPPDGSPPDAIAATDGARGLSVSSCRDLHARLPDAGSGAYELTLADGGTVKADCDMESFDGGWTRVTQAMIVEEKAVQDYAPAVLLTSTLRMRRTRAAGSPSW